MRSHNDGFSLIEVLIAIFILGVGVLGAAAMQLNALKYNQFADVRSQATYLAYEIVDKMRANRKAAIEGEYELSMDSEMDGEGSSSDVGAVADLQVWRSDLKRLLPGGKGSISQENNTNRYTITVSWDESRLGDKSNSGLEDGVRLNKFVFVTEI